MSLATAREIKRLEDAIYRFNHTRDWEIKQVQFPSVANTDVDVAHGLTPANPEAIDILVLKQNRPGDIYADHSPDRILWSDGVIRLRSTAPGIVAVLLLSVSDDATSRLLPAALSHDIVIPGSDDTGVTIGSVGTSSGNGREGPGIELDGETTAGAVGKWAILPASGPLGASANNRALAIVDLSNATGALPLWLWHRGSTSTYHLSPDSVTGALTPTSIGDIHQTFGAGRFERGYFKGLDVGTFSSDNSAAGVISASAGYRERSRTVAMGEWQAYTTTFTNLTVGDGIVSARYTHIGKTVHFKVILVFGTTTTVSNLIAVSLPTSLTANGTVDSPGRCVAYDADTGGYYSGVLIPATGTSTYALFSNGSSGANLAHAGPTTPITWAVNDQLFLEGTYEEP